MILTRLLKTNNICDVGHVDSTFQLKTSLSFRIQRRLIFLHHKLRLLLVGIDIFATEKYSLEEIDMVLKAMLVTCHFGKQTIGSDSTSLSLSLPLSPLTTWKVPNRRRSPNDSIFNAFQSSTRSDKSSTAAVKCSLWIASLAKSNTVWMQLTARVISACSCSSSNCLRSS